jgi:hypothetical protein
MKFTKAAQELMMLALVVQLILNSLQVISHRHPLSVLVENVCHDYIIPLPLLMLS